MGNFMHAAGARRRPPAISTNWALFLDVDGCLVEFGDDPSTTRATPRLVAALDAVSERLCGAVALVSGRMLASLDRVFASARYPAAGMHGLEWRDGDAGPCLAEQVRMHDLGAVAARARAAMAGYPGALVEEKGAALALHWRAAPEAEPVATEFAGNALRELPGYRLEPGNHVIELRPAGVDKGAAVRRFMAQPPFAGRVPVFVGDDLTDEAGFAAADAMGGIGILVGDREGSRARHGLADPAAVLAWLEALP